MGVARRKDWCVIGQRVSLLTKPPALVTSSGLRERHAGLWGAALCDWFLRSRGYRCARIDKWCRVIGQSLHQSRVSETYSVVWLVRALPRFPASSTRWLLGAALCDWPVVFPVRPEVKDAALSDWFMGCHGNQAPCLKWGVCGDERWQSVICQRPSNLRWKRDALCDWSAGFRGYQLQLSTTDGLWAWTRLPVWSNVSDKLMSWTVS